MENDSGIALKQMILKHDFKYDGLRLLKESKVFWSTSLNVCLT